MPIKCPFCLDYKELPIRNKEGITEHLIVTMDKRSHFHIHGPTKNQNLMMAFIIQIAKEAGIEIEGEEFQEEPREESRKGSQRESSAQEIPKAQETHSEEYEVKLQKDGKEKSYKEQMP